MQSKNYNAVNGGVYETPKCEIIEMKIEGAILSDSLRMDSSHEGYTEINWTGIWNNENN